MTFGTHAGGRTRHGFTMIEILMVIVLLGVLVSLAMPDLTAFVTKGRVTGLTNELLGDLSYARSEAATRQADVAICVSTNQTSCTGGETWDKGRLIFVDTNADGALSIGESVLRVSQAMNSMTLTSNGFGGADVIRFRPFGGLRPAAGGNIKLCPASGTEGRTISVAITGRPLISKSTCP
jgi:type IV fimbrial biogenesis protein FimT